ncbi:MAG: NAD(+) diphosphatase [Lachnospiraceae bacterium]|nr:NAD(+) diphosphatase [Lachnospiraceae bacterium]
MLQDIQPHKLHNEYDHDAVANATDIVVIVAGSKVLARIDELSNAVRLPIIEEIWGLDDFDGKKLTYLFSVDNERYFIYEPIEDEKIIDEVIGYKLIDLRYIRENSLEPKSRVFAMHTAKHLSDWYADSKFCGRCGHKMKHSITERAMCCPECGYIQYPRIMPAVIVGVINGDRLLITKYKSGYAHNALIAGFTEIGETLEETVAREVMEEVGIMVRNIKYYKSQPWGMANDILAGFFCEVDGNDEIYMDGSELKYAQWVEREDIELQPDDSSLTNEMMKMFKIGRIRR